MRPSQAGRKRAFWVLGGAGSRALLEVVVALANTWRGRGALDHTAAEGLGLAVSAIAAEVAAGAANGRPPRSTSPAILALGNLAEDSATRIQHRAAQPLDVTIVEVHAFVRLFFYGPHQGWRVLRACETCGEFFALNPRERQRRFCKPLHQPSRSVESVGHRVTEHRKRRRPRV